MLIGPRIKHARESIGFTIAELAGRSGYSERAIEGWENQTTIPPSFHAVAGLAKAMGMDPRILSGDPHFPHGYIEACLDPWRGVSDEDRQVIEE